MQHLEKTLLVVEQRDHHMTAVRDFERGGRNSVKCRLANPFIRDGFYQRGKTAVGGHPPVFWHPMLGAHMQREIEEQIAALPRVAPLYREQLGQMLRRKKFECVLLAARGSSDNAALYGRYLVEIFLGIPAILSAPSVLTRFGVRVRYPKCLCIGISQSGAAPDVAEVLEAARQDRHTTLALTNVAGSRIAQVAEHVLLFDVGEERALAATKTYTASLLALALLVEALGGPLASHYPSASAGAESIPLPDTAWLELCREAAQAGAPILVESTPCFALGRGFSFATAQESALKLMECALVSCKGYSTADFQHGPKALAGPGSVAIVYGEKPVGLEDQGCRLILCPSAPCAEPFQPIWQSVFAQCLALEAARLKGLDPDKPPFLQKVTKTL